MTQEVSTTQKLRFWFVVVATVIFLVFIYFYEPFEVFLVNSIPAIHFENVIFWFSSVIGILGYAVSHWQSFKKNIIGNVSELNVGRLVFDTLQTAIFVAAIFCAGAIVQAVAILAVRLTGQSSAPTGASESVSGNLFAIVLLVILALMFYLLHLVVRAFRDGWHTRRRHPGSTSSSKF